jgi:hypothetical protein
MQQANNKVAAAVALALGLGAGSAFAQQPANQPGTIRWFGSVYAKFLDGNRNEQTALYNNAETTPGEGGGDQGQGIEFELLFNSQVSKQVEIGGRLQGRFNRNFWANFGGFGGPDNKTDNGGEDDPRENQYVKVRGVWARITPGYEWIDSATIGNSDWGMFDPLTQGKFRYIDRDNAAGFLFQGSLFDKKVRWDIARVSLSKLFQGPQFNTGTLYAQDANWVLQTKFTPNADFNATFIGMYMRDKELDPDDTDILNGSNVLTRYSNTVLALKAQYSGLGFMDISGSYYDSSFDLADNVCDLGINGNCRFSPTPKRSTDGESYFLNLEMNDLGVDGLTIAGQYFFVGADYVSVTSARRESDVLLTEGQEGTWMWGRPDYNCVFTTPIAQIDPNSAVRCGNRANRNAAAGLGYGGFTGEVQQVVSGMADNDFLDFNEPVAYSVIGWKGFTVVPKFKWRDWEFQAEYSDISFDTNWQACGGATKGDCIYPRMEGTHAWGLGGDYRSPYAPYQDRSIEILALKANYTLDVGNGIDFGFRYKYISDEDNRVTSTAGLADAYDGYPDAAFALNPDWNPNVGLRGCLECDDRRADYDTYGFSVGYQVNPDLYARLIYDRHEVELIDGTIDVAPVGMGFEVSNDFGYAEYLTGDHTKNRLGLNLSYFLSGVEFGGAFDYIWGTYTPKFFTDSGGARVPLLPGAGVLAIATPLGNIPISDAEYEQYRMKVFMKVSF